MAETQRKGRGLTLLGIAAVAGVIAGAVAVYVRGEGHSNAAGCDLAVAAAARAAPMARGEVAAFRVVETGERFDELAFTAPDGAPLTLADFAGKAVLLNLWATWCAPCRAEMPALDRLQAAIGGDDFEVVAVNVDVRAEAQARAFLNDISVTSLAFYSDPSLGTFNSLKRRGRALGLPVTLLIDANGCAIGGVEGPAEWDSQDARALIAAALTTP